MRLTTLRTVLVLLALASIARAQPRSPWTPFGPGGGSIFSLAVDPGSSAVVYVVAGERDEDSALYRSTDGGATWEDAARPPVPPGLLTIGFLGAFPAAPPSPSTPSPLFLLGFEGITVYRSDDGAESWRPAAALPAPAGLSPSLAIDPGSLERWHVTSAGGSLNSADGGRTWTLGSAGLPHPIAFPLGMSALAAAPSRPGLLYAGLDEWGIARSTSDGAGWRIGVETGLNGSIVRFPKLD